MSLVVVRFRNKKVSMRQDLLNKEFVMYSIGSRVVILSGALADLTGEVVHLKENNQCLLSVDDCKGVYVIISGTALSLLA